MLLTLPYDCAIHFEYACCCHLGVQNKEVPFGGRLPLLYGPLPAMPGHVLSEALHAGDVWTVALWSVAVLSAHSHELDGCCWLDELCGLADYNSDPHPVLWLGWPVGWSGSMQACGCVEDVLVASLVCTALP